MGVIYDSKTNIADLVPKLTIKKYCDMIQRPNFSENSSVLVKASVPYYYYSCLKFVMKLCSVVVNRS